MDKYSQYLKDLQYLKEFRNTLYTNRSYFNPMCGMFRHLDLIQCALDKQIELCNKRIINIKKLINENFKTVT